MMGFQHYTSLFLCNNTLAFVYGLQSQQQAHMGTSSEMAMRQTQTVTERFI